MSTFASLGPQTQRNPLATLYVGGLSETVDEALLWELMVQAGPLASLFMPKDKITGKMLNYAFVEYVTESSADYAQKIFAMLKLCGRPMKINKSKDGTGAGVADVSVGANLFIGNLEESCDEKLLYDTFCAFGTVANTPHIVRDKETVSNTQFSSQTIQKIKF